MGQRIIKNKFGVEDLNIPVLHYPQILALAFGFSPKEIGLQQHTASTASFAAKIKKSAAATGGGE
jgi:heterodisulfide reductase subunit B